MKHANKIQKLIGKGVRITAPESVEIGDDIDPDRISGDNVVIHAGCRIFGKSTLILPGTCLGAEAPVTVIDCQIGRSVELKGGSFKEAVFLEGASAGSGSHVREGTILEEEASIAHTVGLKQTILFPYVTLGSLINFCDCLMAGGTDKRNHSEVGSSYIHFNYTPNQDKATASLIGDVPRGVMLNQYPIFLGGQGGLVGPCRLEYGTVIAAGTIQRKDERRSGRLIIGGGGGKSGNVPYFPGRYHGEKRIVTNNISYIANLIALYQWYGTVRSQFISPEFSQPLFNGALQKISRGIGERIQRFEEFIYKFREQRTETENVSEKLHNRQKEIGDRWPELRGFIESVLERAGEEEIRDRFFESLQNEINLEGRSYLRVIKALDRQTAATGTGWLQSIVDQVTSGTLDIIPSFR